MRIQCDKCNVNYKIEEYKERLRKILNENNYNLFDDSAIALSNEINNFTSKCVDCDKNNSFRFNIGGSSKGCEKLFYYGKEHLFSNLCHYIKNGIINNELIYISMNETKFNQLMGELKANKLPVKNNIRFKDLDEIELKNNEYCLSMLKEKVREIFSFNRVKFRGVRWIIEPMAINNIILQKYVLDVEKLIYVYKENTQWNILNIYDSYKFMYKESDIRNKLME